MGAIRACYIFRVTQKYEKLWTLRAVLKIEAFAVKDNQNQTCRISTWTNTAEVSVVYSEGPRVLASLEACVVAGVHSGEGHQRSRARGTLVNVFTNKPGSWVHRFRDHCVHYPCYFSVCVAPPR